MLRSESGFTVLLDQLLEGEKAVSGTLIICHCSVVWKLA